MEKAKLNDIIPKDGFLKIQSCKNTSINSKDRIALIRRGNEFFNNGEYSKAKKIFLTTGYSDGIIRLGDYYMKHDDPFEALRMYWLAPAPDRVVEISKDFAMIIRQWIK